MGGTARLGARGNVRSPPLVGRELRVNRSAVRGGGAGVSLFPDLVLFALGDHLCAALFVIAVVGFARCERVMSQGLDQR